METQVGSVFAETPSQNMVDLQKATVQRHAVAIEIKRVVVFGVTVSIKY
jgi:hypothetical protein